MPEEEAAKTAKELEEEYKEQMDQEIAQLNLYRQALEEEFANADPEDVETANKAKKRAIELVPTAGETLKFLLNHSNSEAIKKDIAKWVFEIAMRSAKESTENDELAELLKGLTKKDPTPVEDN